MELIYLKNLMMCRLPKVNIKIYLFVFVMLLYFDCTLSISPQASFSDHQQKNFLQGIPTLNTSSSEPHKKSICHHTRADGSKISYECDSINSGTSIKNSLSSNETVPHLNHSKENGTNIDNSKISKNNVTSINSVKHICNGTLQSSETKICSSEFPNVDHFKRNHLQTNVTMPSNSTNKNISSLNHLNGTTNRSTEIASLNDKSHKYVGGMDVDEKLNISTSHENINSLKNSSNTKSKPNGNKFENSDANPSHLQRNDSSSKSLVSTRAAGIAAAICVLMASAAYISLMVWRRISYNRYGNREMLINEDDLGDIHDEDMRHFELKLLDKEGKVIES